MQQPCEDPGTPAWDLDMANGKGALSALAPSPVPMQFAPCPWLISVACSSASHRYACSLHLLQHQT